MYLNNLQHISYILEKQKCCKKEDFFCDENKTFLLSPDGSGNTLVPGFGIRDCNGQRDYSCGGQKICCSQKKIHTDATDKGATKINFKTADPFFKAPLQQRIVD